MALPIITMVIASLAALLQLVLTAQVIRCRRAEQAGVGVKPSSGLQRAIRAHGNFVEVTPIFLILLLILELVDAYLWWVGGLGALFLIGRVLHAQSILVGEAAEPPRYQNRVRGMMLTLGSMALAALSGPVYIVWLLFNPWM